MGTAHHGLVWVLGTASIFALDIGAIPHISSMGNNRKNVGDREEPNIQGRDV